MAEEEQNKNIEDTDDQTYIKLSELKLKALEREYQETISADNKLNQAFDDLHLKGKFEQENFNNVQFINNNEEKNNQEQQQQDQNEEDDDFNKDEYQQIEDDDNENNQSSDDNWGEFQDTKEQKQEQIEDKDQKQIDEAKPDEKKLDVELIKSIMAKIDIKPPEWAKNEEEWNQKLKQMFGKQN